MTQDQGALYEFLWRNTITDDYRMEDYEEE